LERMAQSGGESYGWDPPGEEPSYGDGVPSCDMSLMLSGLSGGRRGVWRSYCPAVCLMLVIHSVSG
jgi:hypothetical protein